MERVFANILEDKVLISDEDKHHLLNVMRLKRGDKIEIVDSGDLFKAEIISTNPFELAIIGELSKPTELNIKMVLGFSLLKGGHDELVLMKGTELGVSTFLPFISERTIIRLDEKDRAKRLERFEKIVSGASSQSKRLIKPDILPIMDYKKALNQQFDKKYLAYENLSDAFFNLPSEINSIKAAETALFMVGPEGGFSINEVELAKNNGFKFVSLGKRILRAETASIYLASIFSFIGETK